MTVVVRSAVTGPESSHVCNVATAHWSTGPWRRWTWYPTQSL